MNQPIDFFFDFSSPYGYFTAERIETHAAKHNTTTNWHPFLLGAVFKITGRQPIAQIPLMSEYVTRDVLRTARYHNLSVKIPSIFPIASIAPCRAYYWLAQTNPEAAKQLALDIYRAYFLKDVDISKPENILDIIAQTGHNPEEAAKGMSSPEIKDHLRSATDHAIERGVFGSPYLFVNDEPFWGNDKLAEVDEWLTKGGW